MNAVFENDNGTKYSYHHEKDSPLDYLHKCNADGFLCLIRELCLYREDRMNDHDHHVAAGGSDFDNVGTRTKKRKIESS